MTLTKLRKEMKHMASELTGRLQYSPELYKIRFDIEDGRYTIWDPNNNMMMDYQMDRSEPFLTFWYDGFRYVSTIFKKSLSIYKAKEHGKIEDIDWNEFKEVYNKISYENQI